MDRLGDPRRPPQLHLLRDGDDVPEAIRRHRHLRPRGVEEVLLVRRPGCRVRLLDRLVGGAVRDRRGGGIPRPVRVVPVLRHLHQLESQLADPGQTDLLQLPDRPDGRDHPRDLGLQRVGDAPGGLGRLRHRGTADVAAGGDDVPAVHHRRLAQLQPAQQHTCHRQLTGSQQLHARDRVALCDVLVELRHGVLRHLRSRVPRHGPGHAQGAARRGDLRRDHLRAAADGGDGNVRRPEHDGREPLHVHAPDASHPDGRHTGRLWRCSRCVRASCWR